MGSDRARISYNPGQLYRSVVMQQGRVTLEADWNEAQTIAGEQLRRETLDIVGPAGTWRNDNGYAISLIPASGGNPPSYDFTIASGSMYVGGERAYLPATINYSAQPEGDWMDFAQDPDWVALYTSNPGFNEYVYLLLREQEVSAVEDSDLKDIALGGPDTAQRTRLIQHIVRHKTTGTDCPSAMKDVQANWWNPSGYQLNQADMRVESFGRLQVGFVNTVTTSPCNPAAQGGYLGADNQLIRVQISDSSASDLSFVWGYDDASFLYEVSIVSPGSLTTPTTLKLNTAPVDAEHIPQSGQAVELLLPAAQLSNGQYVAAQSGQIFVLGAAAFTPGANTLTLPPGINTSLFGTGPGGTPNPPQLYLRVWQGQSSFTPGAAQTLSNTATGVNTGLNVTLTTAQSGESFRVGDYWMFAVRPPSPDIIYPERYTAAPQPPDGPREWICPLAVIQWTENPPVATPCTNTFLNLVQLSNESTGGCCSVYVSADDHNSETFTIQDAINEVIGTGGRICLGPGTFNITSTIELSSVTLPIEIGGMGASPNLEETTGVTVLTMAAPATPQTAPVPAFLIDGSTGVAIQDLQLNFAPGYVSAGNPATGAAGTSFANPGIMIQNSYSVTVQRCTFSCVGNTLDTNAAIAIGGLVYRIAISDCLFEYTLTDSTSVSAYGAGYGITNLVALNQQFADESYTCLTFDLFISGNVFENVTYGIEFDATCYHLGQVIVSGNEFGPCAAAAVIAGSGLPPLYTNVEITGNQVIESFTGFACGLAARIADNTLLLTPVATPASSDAFIGGIVITAPVLDSVIDGIEITGNRIVGGSGWGILIEAQTSAAEISHNIIEATTCGGIGANGVDHLSIANNQLLGLVPNSSDPGVGALLGAYGILVLPSSVNGTAVQAGYVEVLGNVIKDFATDSTQSTVGSISRYAIAIEGCNSTIIAGNHLINIGPANDAIDTSAAVYSVAYPFDRIDISNNVIRRNDSGTVGDTGSSWYGVDISGFISERYFNPGQAGTILNQKVVQVSEKQYISIGIGIGFFIPAGGLQNVHVSGNYVEAAGSVPAVSVDVTGACIFTGNQCILATASQNVATPVADIEGANVVASNNILQNSGKDSVSLEITTSSSTTANSYTVLGNITSAPISANGAALNATLLALNATV
jgi:hypothetical protein